MPAHIIWVKKKRVLRKKARVARGNALPSPNWLTTYSDYPYSPFSSKCLSILGNQKSSSSSKLDWLDHIEDTGELSYPVTSVWVSFQSWIAVNPVKVIFILNKSVHESWKQLHMNLQSWPGYSRSAFLGMIVMATSWDIYLHCFFFMKISWKEESTIALPGNGKLW